MTDRDRRERLAEYVAVLRGFGRSDEEILAAHGEDAVPDGFSLPEFFDHRFDDAEESTLYERLHDTLATGAAGIDADREYWGHAPARQLDDACRPHGWRVDLSGDDPISITVVTPDGERRESTFTYPASDLGEHNYPALAAAVAEHLDGLTFALLTDRDGRWRLVCVETDHLAELRERYGERVRVFRRPLLRAEQLPDFAAADDAREAHDRGSELASVAGDAFAESVGTGPRVHRSSRSLETEVAVESGPETVVGEGIDEVFETIEADADTGRTDAPAANESVDDDVASLLSDLDEPTRSGDEAGDATVTRSAASAADGTDDGSGPTGSAGLVGGGPETTVVEDGLEDVFAGLEETNPPVSEDDPERMATDDVLNSVDAEPTDTEPADADPEDVAADADEAAVGGVADEAPPDEGPEPPTDTTAPILDPDELTTPEVETPAPESPGSSEAGDGVPTAGESDATSAADAADTTVVEDGPVALPGPESGDESTADEPVPDEPSVPATDSETRVSETDAGTGGADDGTEAPEATAETEVPASDADPATAADDPASIPEDDTHADAEALADVESGHTTDAVDTEEPAEPAAEPSGEMNDSIDAGEPEATPSIDVIDLDVDEDDIPDVDGDEETSTAGPLAGGVGPDASSWSSEAQAESDADEPTGDVPEQPDISPEEPVDADLLADPDERALADDEPADEFDGVILGRLDDDESETRGPLGRLAAWLRNLF
ncbi:hypothetical protein [Haloarchaeobius litoreus]|uniref:Uncharacterized protein n=1 Tax=Haloarchaeobius litoreus TaxID=755306 RepID=A0ABD6DGQ8_9EURY|nr:hypothetical protein [Haloarchaeobius litoreus]